MATLGPRAAKSEAEVGRAEADPGQDQTVSACAFGAAFGKMLVSKKRE